MDSRKCPYSYCPIPENNTIYLWESIYMLIASIALINFPSTMTAFSIILLLFPSVLELLFAKPKQVLFIVVVWLFRAVDGYVILLCILKLASLIEYKGTQFFVPTTAIFLPGKCLLSTKILAGFLIANLVPPLAYYFGNPCQRTLK